MAADSGSSVQSWPSQGTVSVWPDRMMPAGLPSPSVANRLALVLPALVVMRLATPSLASSSRTKWISSRLLLSLTVFMRTRAWISSRARGETAGRAARVGARVGEGAKDMASILAVFGDVRCLHRQLCLKPASPRGVFPLPDDLFVLLTAGPDPAHAAAPVAEKRLCLRRPGVQPELAGHGAGLARLLRLCRVLLPLQHGLHHQRLA
jgi:hypothetical protein